MSNITFNIFRADLKNRIRRHNFMLSLVCMSILTFFFFPPLNSGYQTLVVHGYRGVYNSAWMGETLAMLNILFLPAICFYLIKNAVEQDRNNRICEFLASTSITKTQYIIGKWLSNLTLLLIIAVVMTITTIILQLYIGEETTIRFSDYLIPLIVFVLPVLSIVAASALLFETIPGLKGAQGNILYFFLWIALILNTMEGFSGVNEVLTQMAAITVNLDTITTHNTVHLGISKIEHKVETFLWQGVQYNLSILLSILISIFISIIFLLISVKFFDRFSTGFTKNSVEKNPNKYNQHSSYLINHLDSFLNYITKFFSFTRLMRVEIMLMLKGKHLSLFIVLTILCIAQFVANIDITRNILVPISLILCISFISQLGQREEKYNTHLIIFSCASPLKFQFFSMLVSGVFILLMVTSGAIFNYLVSGEPIAALMLVIGIIFIVSLAVFCGVVTKTSRTFEALFPLLWYVGAIKGFNELDFLGKNIANIQKFNLPMLYLTASLLLILISVTIRYKRISNYNS